MTDVERLDVVIFGASGYTGKNVIYESVKLLAGLKWGIAGRNMQKLKEVLVEMGRKAAKDLSEIPTIIADVKNDTSLFEMAAQAKVIVNCCGPFRKYGEPVVKACIEAGTNHIDVSGEPQYMETMQLRYHEQAREKGIYIVSACGFDSIPADLGVVYLQQQFDGTVNSVESYLRLYFANNYKPSGAYLNYGTYESAVHGFAHANELRAVRSQLYPKRLPRFQPTLKERPSIHRSDEVNRWCLPFLGSDRSVVMRSQRHFFDKEQKRPVQMRAYVAFDSIIHVIFLSFFAIVFGLFSKFSIGQKLLLAYPRLFTFGLASRCDGPTEELNENLFFEMTFCGQGWKEKQQDPNSQFDMPATKRMVTRVMGSNPGYGLTCVCLLVSALTILKESAKMPSQGGVFSPAAAFANTNIINELQKNYLTFEVIKKE